MCASVCVCVQYVYDLYTCIHFAIGHIYRILFAFDGWKQIGNTRKKGTHTSAHTHTHCQRRKRIAEWANAGRTFQSNGPNASAVCMCASVYVCGSDALNVRAEHGQHLRRMRVGSYVCACVCVAAAVRAPERERDGRTSETARSIGAKNSGKGKLYKIWRTIRNHFEKYSSTVYVVYSVIEPLISFYEFVSSGYSGQEGVEFYYY